MTSGDEQMKRVLKRLDAAWAEFRESYAGLPDAQLTEPGVTGEWSVKDILAHVTTWEEEALNCLPIVIAGGRPPRYALRGGIDVFNAEMAAQKRDLSLSDAAQKLDETHCRLIDFIQGVPADQFAPESRFCRRLRLDTYNHYPKHAEAIREWREQRSAGSGKAETVA